MSKLQFREESLELDGTISDTNPVVSLNKDKLTIESVKGSLPIIRKSIQTTSSQLLDLTSGDNDNDDENNNVDVGHKDAQESKDTSIKETKPFTVKEIAIESTAVSSPINVEVEIVSAAKPPSRTTTTIISNKSVSSWLGKFLENKRTVIDPNSLVPDIEVSNNTYLREFCEVYKVMHAGEDTNMPLKVANESISDDSSSDEEDSKPHKELALLDGNDVLSLMDESQEKTTAEKSLPLNLFNLPYNTDVEQV